MAISQSNCNYWSTYIGQTGSDEIKGVAVDANKNSYIIMQTNSASLAITPNLISDTIVGDYDAYIAKFDSCGVFIWGTYLGTTSFDSGEKIVLCSDGNLAITGFAQDTGLPTTSACFQPTFAGQSDCFLGKITPNGHLLWLTYFGSTGGDLAYDLSTDPMGNIYIGGATTSTNLYLTSASFQQTFGGNIDAFFARFSPTGAFRWSTNYGGLGSEDIHAITCDNSGNVFGTGASFSFNLSTSPGCIQPSKDNSADCYLIKLDSVGGRVFSTYLGGNGQDDAYGLATDNTGNLYIGGQTSSTNFTTTTGAFQSTLTGMTDIYFAKISSAGNLLYSTYFGGSDIETTARLKFYNNELYLLAITSSTDIPILGASTYSTLPGALNFYIARFNTNGIPNYSTYFGSNNFGYDYANDFEVKGNHLFLSGKATSADYPVSSNAYQPIYNGGDDGVLTKLALPTNTLVSSHANQQLHKEISFYPNPTQDILKINLTSNKKEIVSIYNSIGMLEKQETVETEINVSELKSGIYFIKINGATAKFVKID